MASTTDPLGHTTTYEYDSTGSLIGQTDPLGHQTAYAYNLSGQTVSVTDPLSQTTQLNYDRGDLISVTTPLGHTTSRFVDAAGRGLSLKNALGETVRFQYDALNRITSVTDPLAGTTSFSYDPEGNLLSLTDPRGSITSYTYDSMGRMLSRTDPLSHAESFEYDLSGNLTTLTDRRGKVTSYSFDALHRRTFAGFGTTVAGGMTTYESTITYSYDGALPCGCGGTSGRLAQVVDSLSGTVSYAYDNLDRITSETTPQGTIGYSYDAHGRRTSMTVGGQSSVSYDYDNADRLTQITQAASSVSVVYDNANKVTSITLPNGVISEYSYDAGSRLTGINYRKGATVLGNLTYEYEEAGRRTRIGGTYARTGLPQSLTSASYDTGNRQLGFGGQTLTYDANGNLTSDGTNSLTWDARNHLVSMTATGLNASFQYDALGRRINKTVNGTSTSFLYDGLNVVQEQVGGTPTANMLTGLGVDEVFMRADSSGGSGLLTDALGSTIGLADTSGTVQTEYTYDPFGQTTQSGGAGTNLSQYNRRENDGTGLYYYRARYYSSTLQRFISEDPAGFQGGINLYGYVGNNPVSGRDPLGLMDTATCVVGFAVAGALVGAVLGGVVGVAGIVGGPLVLITSPGGAFVGSGIGLIAGGIIGGLLCTERKPPEDCWPKPRKKPDDKKHEECLNKCLHLLPSPSGDLQASEFTKCYKECMGFL
jgi:RHS repeat-associated protein